MIDVGEIVFLSATVNYSREVRRFYTVYRYQQHQLTVALCRQTATKSQRRQVAHRVTTRSFHIFGGYPCQKLAAG